MMLLKGLSGKQTHEHYLIINVSCIRFIAPCVMVFTELSLRLRSEYSVENEIQLLNYDVLKMQSVNNTKMLNKQECEKIKDAIF